MKPYYDEGGVTLYNADCRSVGNLADMCDVTIADPPYGQTSLEWDSWVPLWPRIVPGHALFCFGSLRMFTEHFEEFAGWRFGQDLVWEKHNGSSFHADRFRRIHEQIVHFYRGEWEAQRRAVPVTMDVVRRTVKRRKERPPHMGEIEGGSYQSEDGGPRLMTTVLRVRSCHGSAVHPTQKPEGIVAPLIEYATAPGDWIFDPFTGSGTVLAVARQMGRRAVGFEVDEQYCELAAKRLSQGVLAFQEPSTKAATI